MKNWLVPAKQTSRNRPLTGSGEMKSLTRSFPSMKENIKKLLYIVKRYVWKPRRVAIGYQKWEGHAIL